MITIKINCSRLLKEHLFKGKNGTYADLVAFENKKGPDQYGNTHFVCQSVSKEARDKGVRGPIVGNLKLTTTNSKPAPADSKPPPRDEDVPF